MIQFQRIYEVIYLLRLQTRFTGRQSGNFILRQKTWILNLNEYNQEGIRMSTRQLKDVGWVWEGQGLVHPFVNSSTLDAGSLQRPVAHTTDYRAPRKDIFSPLSTRVRHEHGLKGEKRRVASIV